MRFNLLLKIYLLHFPHLNKSHNLRIDFIDIFYILSIYLSLRYDTDYTKKFLTRSLYIYMLFKMEYKMELYLFNLIGILFLINHVNVISAEINSENEADSI